MKQDQIVNTLVGPTYRNPENKSGFRDVRMPDIQRTRALQISRDDDTVENLKVGIEDIDGAIMYYFLRVIRPVVEVNGTVVPVPITYATPERWADVQKLGYYRDKSGKKQLPVIIFKRDSIKKNRNLTNKLDANRPHNFYVTAVGNSRRNSYTRFDLIHNRVPEKDLVVTVVPDFVDVEYSCIILTDFVSQMNPIIESITFASDAYWGDVERFQFQSFVSDIRTEVSNNKGEDRLVKSSFNLKLRGYILPETTNANAYVNQKKHNKTNYSYKITEKEIR